MVNVENRLSRFASWYFSHLPDRDVEYLTILSVSSDIQQRAPGKYDPILTAIEIVSNFNPYSRIKSELPILGLFPAVQPAYVWGRAHDDMADGDRRVPAGFSSYKDYVEYLKGHLRTGCVGIEKDYTDEFLMKRVLLKLEREVRPDDDVREEMCAFLDAMVVESERRLKQKVLTRVELDHVYKESFSHAYNLTLIAMRSRNRVRDLGRLPELQGRVYALCDLETELPNGICNIPLEVVEESGLLFNDLMRAPSLAYQNPRVRLWIEDELDIAPSLVEQLKQRYLTLDWKAKLLAKFMLKGVESGVKKVEQKLEKSL